MRQTLNQIKQETQRKLSKRKNLLLKKYQNVQEDAIPDSVFEELDKIEALLQEVSIRKIPNQINIKMGELEKWYFTMMFDWMSAHPESFDSKSISMTEIYKFALHFFVENIVTVPGNSLMQVEKLRRKIGSMGEANSIEKNIYRQLEDIKNLAAFNSSMVYTLADLSKDFPDGVANILSTQQENEMDSSTRYAQVFAKFINQRQLTKQNIKNRNSSNSLNSDY
ncbi:hypothetical protein WOSG25_110760 [Weissella oryzae SG25]|uniref:Uncharacterized protein n=1 Tax=Weissella oryzae (strain DSM 25784 / JCM 18191 / LMG 30913 / SG25) TaxID=1329250 RepID=A0A069CWJ0_WEIOS|nr:hypothetical protein [Weissella oryzae]GAK31598.1 hypothetical protein WOSG25_110760 [Weissella oryzae SG25]